MTGQCKLCLQHGAKLEDSHFLSAGIYRILRDDGVKNPNPWMLTKRGTIQTSRQLKARLLCRACEERFSKNGENWVLRRCLKKDGSFPLAALLNSRTPDLSSPSSVTRIYYAARIPEIDISALTYFAASIFWRGSIYEWNEDGSVPVNLGPFQEAFRRYLIQQEPFPDEAMLWVAVRDKSDIDRITYAPVGGRMGTVHFYKFPMPGFAFSLTVSKNIPAKQREWCFVHGHGHPLIATNLVDKFLFNDAVKMRQTSLGHSRA